MNGIAILSVLAALVVLALMVLPLWRASRAAGRRVPGLEALLTGSQRRSRRLLVYFWSPSCGVCRQVTPVVDQLATENSSVVQVDISEHRALAREFAVMATPSFAVVEDGVIRRLVVGARDAQTIRSLLKS